MISFLRECEEFCHSFVERHIPIAAPYARRYARVLRYLVAGGTAAFVDLGILYLLTDWFGMHYLLSATLAFVIAFCVSFFLQKFWTFGDETRDRMHAQATVYFVIAVANVFANLGLMYLLVDVFGIWYMLAQIFVGAAIACYSFLIYRTFVFKTQIHADGDPRTGAKLGTGHGADTRG